MNIIIIDLILIIVKYIYLVFIISPCMLVQFFLFNQLMHTN
jgi:hypothetical protein